MEKKQRDEVLKFRTWREAFEVLFEHDMRGEIEKAKSYSINPLVSVFFENREDIDSLIQESANMRLSILSPVERNILRVSASGILFGLDVPFVIKRALKLSDMFSTPGTSRFIHVAVSRIAEKVAGNTRKKDEIKEKKEERGGKE
jgi:transcription termination factor NusB